MSLPVNQASPRHGERCLLGAYAALSVLWLAASSLVHHRLRADVGYGVESALHAAFAAISTVMIYLLLRRMRRVHEAVTACETAALREQANSAQLLQTLADHSPDAIFAKDREGRYVLFNRAAMEFAGAAPDATSGSVLGRDDDAMFPPEAAAAIRARDHAVMQQERPQTFEETLDTALGPRTFLTTKGPMHDAEGAIGVFGIARDITQMVQARQQLMLSEQRFRLAAAGGDVWDWDVIGQRAESQSAFWQRLGHEPPADADAWQRLHELMHPDDGEHWQAALRAHIVERKPYALEFRARHRNGHWRWFRTQGQAVWDESGRATYMAGTTFDVTDRRHAEDALLRTQSELSHLTRRLMEQERETTARLAQSLHDRLGQALGGARLHLDLALDAASSDSAQRLGRVSTLLDAAIGEVRRVLVELRPPLLSEQGLAAALDNEVRRGAASGLGVTVRLDASASASKARWPETVEHAAFMIAREGLANALQHAQAAHVRLVLSGDGQSLDLRVDHDGHGIADDERLSRPGHLGLVGMRERAASIGAALSIERRSAPGERGTTLRLAWAASA